MIQVGVCGSSGRMGTEACKAIEADPETELVARVDSDGAVSEFEEAGAEVVVDFTVASAARVNLPALAAAGIHAVVGTSGLADADLKALESVFARSHCAVVANFALGAVLMQRFAAMAAPYFETAEVVELHHDGKTDTPSGTAMRTVESMAAASRDWATDPTRTETIPGARGALGPAGIRVHSVRLKGLVAHQEVMLGGPGEVLTIRHDSIDRSSFMPGMMLAVKSVADQPPGLSVGFGDMLGL